MAFQKTMETANEVRKLLESLKKSFQCTICLDLLTQPVSTKCNHQFCKKCFNELLQTKRKGKNAKCPLCNANVTKRSLHTNPNMVEMVSSVRNVCSAADEDCDALDVMPLLSQRCQKVKERPGKKVSNKKSLVFSSTKTSSENIKSSTSSAINLLEEITNAKDNPVILEDSASSYDKRQSNKKESHAVSRKKNNDCFDNHCMLPETYPMDISAVVIPDDIQPNIKASNKIKKGSKKSISSIEIDTSGESVVDRNRKTKILSKEEATANVNLTVDKNNEIELLSKKGAANIDGNRKANLSSKKNFLSIMNPSVDKNSDIIQPSMSSENSSEYMILPQAHKNLLGLQTNNNELPVTENEVNQTNLNNEQKKQTKGEQTLHGIVPDHEIDFVPDSQKKPREVGKTEISTKLKKAENVKNGLRKSESKPKTKQDKDLRIETPESLIKTNEVDNAPKSKYQKIDETEIPSKLNKDFVPHRTEKTFEVLKTKPPIISKSKRKTDFNSCVDPFKKSNLDEMDICLPQSSCSEAMDASFSEDIPSTPSSSDPKEKIELLWKTYESPDRDHVLFSNPSFSRRSTSNMQQKPTQLISDFQELKKKEKINESTGAIAITTCLKGVAGNDSLLADKENTESRGPPSYSEDSVIPPTPPTSKKNKSSINNNSTLGKRIKPSNKSNVSKMLDAKEVIEVLLPSKVDVMETGDIPEDFDCEPMIVFTNEKPPVKKTDKDIDVQDCNEVDEIMFVEGNKSKDEHCNKQNKKADVNFQIDSLIMLNSQDDILFNDNEIPRSKLDRARNILNYIDDKDSGIKGDVNKVCPLGMSKTKLKEKKRSGDNSIEIGSSFGGEDFDSTCKRNSKNHNNVNSDLPSTKKTKNKMNDIGLLNDEEIGSSLGDVDLEPALNRKKNTKNTESRIASNGDRNDDGFNLEPDNYVDVTKDKKKGADYIDVDKARGSSSYVDRSKELKNKKRNIELLDNENIGSSPEIEISQKEKNSSSSSKNLIRLDSSLNFDQEECRERTKASLTSHKSKGGQSSSKNLIRLDSSLNFDQEEYKGTTKTKSILAPQKLKGLKDPCPVGEPPSEELFLSDIEEDPLSIERKKFTRKVANVSSQKRKRKQIVTDSSSDEEEALIKNKAPMRKKKMSNDDTLISYNTTKFSGSESSDDDDDELPKVPFKTTTNNDKNDKISFDQNTSFNRSALEKESLITPGQRFQHSTVDTPPRKHQVSNEEIEQWKIRLKSPIDGSEPVQSLTKPTPKYQTNKNNRLETGVTSIKSGLFESNETSIFSPRTPKVPPIPISQSTVMQNHGRASSEKKATLNKFSSLPSGKHALRENALHSRHNKLDGSRRDELMISSPESTANFTPVIATTRISKKIMVKCRNIIASLNGQYINEYASELTHLVVQTDENNNLSKAGYTFKYLMALVSGLWIVNYKWLIASFRAKRFVSELEFEAKGDPEYRQENIPRKYRLSHRKTFKSSMFDGYCLYLLGRFNNSQISKGQLIQILRKTNAEIVYSPSEMVCSSSQMKQLLIADGFYDLTKEEREVVLDHGSTVCHPDWVVESIINFQIQDTRSHMIVL